MCLYMKKSILDIVSYIKFHIYSYIIDIVIFGTYSVPGMDYGLWHKINNEYLFCSLNPSTIYFVLCFI